MKKLLSTLLFAFLLCFDAGAQSKSYFTSCEKGDSLYRAGRFLQSAHMYNTAFASFRGNGLVQDRYNAARSWAMAKEPDTAICYLEKIVYNDRYAAHYRLSSDPAFNSLHENIRWKNLVDTAKAISIISTPKIAELEKLFEPQLAAHLDSIREADQRYRRQIGETEKRYGSNSQEMTMLLGMIRYQDSLNLVKVKKVLDTRGWLGPEVVHAGSDALFVVIQHSDLTTQLKYLPMIREAAKNGKLDRGSLAMLEDRVLMRQNKEQIYGTQIRRDSITGKRYLAPLSDVDNVDKRREEIGLGPLSDYLSHWDLVWDPEAYKKEMADRENKTKPARSSKPTPK